METGKPSCLVNGEMQVETSVGRAQRRSAFTLLRSVREGFSEEMRPEK